MEDWPLSRKILVGLLAASILYFLADTYIFGGGADSADTGNIQQNAVPGQIIPPFCNPFQTGGDTERN